MATFVVIPDGSSETLSQKLKAYGNKAMRLPRGDWLVAYNGTSKQLSDELGISDGPAESAIVLNFSAYYGRTNPNIWEWIKVNGS